MPCDCPEEQPRPIPQGGCNYLVHSGGPLSNLYRLVEHIIPDVEMTHGRPTVHSDGSLDFPDPRLQSQVIGRKARACIRPGRLARYGCCESRLLTEC